MVSCFHPVTPELLEDLKKVVGEKYVRYDEDTLDQYQTDEEGNPHLSGTCAVAGLGPREERDGSVAYYLSEPVVDDDVKAAGVLMMVTAELLNKEG